jgi:hypothetical protein
MYRNNFIQNKNASLQVDALILEKVFFCQNPKIKDEQEPVLLEQIGVIKFGSVFQKGKQLNQKIIQAIYYLWLLLKSLAQNQLHRLSIRKALI